MLGFFLTRYGILAIALVASMVGFQIWKVNYGMQKKEEGRKEVIVNSQVEGKKINAKAKKARDATPATNALDELRRDYSR